MNVAIAAHTAHYSHPICVLFYRSHCIFDRPCSTTQNSLLCQYLHQVPALLHHHPPPHTSCLCLRCTSFRPGSTPLSTHSVCVQRVSAPPGHCHYPPHALCCQN